MVTGVHNCHGCRKPVLRNGTRGPIPKWCGDRCRKSKYAGTCKNCGGRTHGGNGRGPNAPLICDRCNRRDWKRPTRRFRKLRPVGIWNPTSTSKAKPGATSNASGSASVRTTPNPSVPSTLLNLSASPLTFRKEACLTPEADLRLCDCTHCAYWRPLAEREAEDRYLAEQDLKKARRTEKALRAQLVDHHKSSPRAKEIQALLATWKRENGKNGLTDVEPGGKRWMLADRGIKRWGLERCTKAVVAHARKPYVGPTGRCAEQPYKGAKRYDDLEYAISDETRLEKWEAEFDTPPEQPEPVNRGSTATLAPPRRKLSHEAIDTVLAALTRRDCAWRPVAPDRWMAQCPAHEDRSPSLSITRFPNGDVRPHCFAGCAQADIRGELGLSVGDLKGEDA